LKVIQEIPRLKELLTFAASDAYLSVVARDEIWPSMSGDGE